MFVNARYGYDVRCEVVGDTGATSLAAAPLTRLDHALQSRTAYPEGWRRFAEAYRPQLQAWIDSWPTTSRLRWPPLKMALPPRASNR